MDEITGFHIPHAQRTSQRLAEEYISKAVAVLCQSGIDGLQVRPFSKGCFDIVAPEGFSHLEFQIQCTGWERAIEEQQS